MESAGARPSNGFSILGDAKERTTAVIRLALAILQAWAMMRVSIKAALVGTVEEEAVLFYKSMSGPSTRKGKQVEFT